MHWISQNFPNISTMVRGQSDSRRILKMCAHCACLSTYHWITSVIPLQNERKWNLDTKRDFVRLLCESGNVEVLQDFLTANTDTVVDQQCLHLACKSGSLDTIVFLLAAGLSWDHNCAVLPILTESWGFLTALLASGCPFERDHVQLMFQRAEQTHRDIDPEFIRFLFERGFEVPSRLLQSYIIERAASIQTPLLGFIAEYQIVAMNILLSVCLRKGNCTVLSYWTTQISESFSKIEIIGLLKAFDQATQGQRRYLISGSSLLTAEELPF
jgi:hypothetical protein